MEDSACNTHEKEVIGEELEDNVIITLYPVLPEPTTERLKERNVSSIDDTSHSDSRPECSRKSKKDHLNKPVWTPKPRLKAPSLPLPASLPPIHMVTRDTLRDWCQQSHLSTDGEKIEVYARLQSHAYPEQKSELPTTSQEARKRLLPKCRKPRKVTKEKKPKASPTMCVHKKSNVANVTDVVTSAQMSMFAAWARIAARAGQQEAVYSCFVPTTAFLEESSGFRWCVVHGQLFPSNMKGWVRLQFCAGYTWVPDSPWKMIALFLLPACVFPSLEVEDNMLCPECVKSNKKIMEHLMLTTKTRQSVSGDNDTMLQDMPSY